MPIVYLLTFPDGSTYIGATVKNLKARLGSHRQAPDRGSLSPLAQALRACRNPQVQTLSEWGTREEAWEAEREAIALLRPTLNLQSGGRPSDSLKGNDYRKGKKDPPESFAKRSAAHMGNQTRKGIPHSAETKRRTSESLKARRALQCH